MKAAAAAAIAAIEKQGIILVFPIDNRREPPSLWYHFHPRTPMRWEWDEGGDNRVGELWQLRAELSASNRVIYTKWYRGRATFLSKSVFTALLSTFLDDGSSQSLSSTARALLAQLEMDSPLSTRVLKKQAELQGRFNESTYQRAMKELWDRLLIVAYGEVDEGAFPSLAIGATKLIFEDLWNKALAMSARERMKILERPKLASSLFLKYHSRLQLRKTLQPGPAGPTNRV